MIAEFMGLKPYKQGHPVYDTNQWLIGRGAEGVTLHDYRKYDRFWDWLMPVVEKIERTGCKVVIESFSCEITTFITGYSKQVIVERKREAVYMAVVEYIKWYNKKIKKVTELHKSLKVHATADLEHTLCGLKIKPHITTWPRHPFIMVVEEAKCKTCDKIVTPKL